MTVKSAAQWSGTIATRDATGALAAAGTGPAGVLYVDGTVNGASVTVSGANPYKWTVTLPALTAGQRVSMYITATIAGVATGAIVAEEQADTALDSDAVTLAATQPAITWGQQKITANVAGEGALDVRNTNASGIGQYNLGGQDGQVNEGIANYGQSNVGQVTGQYNAGTTDYGIEAVGGTNPTNPDWAVAGEAMDLVVDAVNEIADQVWDEAIADHVDLGSTGEALGDASAPAPSAADIWTYGSRSLTTWPAVVTYTGPVTDGGDVVTYQGDSYQEADGRALEWQSDDWPDLAGASIAVIIDRTVSLAGSVVAASGPGIVRLELTATQSASITPGRHLFQIVATQADADVATLVEASWVSRKRAAV